jgi:FkbM family methyltransferase
VYFRLELNQLIDSALHFDGVFEPDTSELLARLAFPGMVYFDVGANVGCHALPMAKMAGPTGRVYAFEPMTWAYKKFLKNLRLNQFSNVVVEKLALGETVGTFRGFFRNQWPISSKQPSIPPTIEEIQVDTMDNFCRRRNVEKVDLIKIDVDGMDLKVLRGGQQTLARFRPRVIVEIGEYTLQAAGDSIESFFYFAKSLNYRIESEKGNLLETVEDIRTAIPDLANSTINVLLRP